MKEEPSLYESKDREFGLFPALLISLFVCVCIIYGFAMIGAENNPYLIQAELVLTLLALSLTGILTRSKLKSLFAIVVAPVAYYVPQAFGVYSPWRLFTEITGPEGILTELLDMIENLSERSGGLPFDLERAQLVLVRFGWLIDVLALGVCAIFVALLVTTIFTGVGRGLMVVFSLILKLLAVVFLIIFLFIVPFFYYGLATTAEGVSYVGIGATHSFMALDELSNPTDSNIDYEYILSELSQASPAFYNASAAFNETRANILADFALQFFDYDEEFEAITHFLRAGTLITAPEGLGEFILGFKDFNAGLNQTLSYIKVFGSFETPTSKMAMIVYGQNDGFNQGLLQLESGLSHFQNGIPNLLASLEEVREGAELLKGLNNPDIDQIVALIPLAQNAIHIMDQVSETIIPLINGTYLMTQAFSRITENRFVAASALISASNFEIDSSQLLLQEISADIDETNTLSPVPFAVYALRDLVTVTSDFDSTAKHIIDTFLSMVDLTNLLTNLQLINILSIQWDPFETQLDFARNNVTYAASNLTRAQSDASAFTDADYGPLNETFHPVMVTLNDSLGQFSRIIDDATTLVDLMDNLYLTVFHFAQGLEFAETSQFSEAAGEFNASITYAETALGLLDEIESLDESMVASLENVLTELIQIGTFAFESAENSESDPDLPEDYEQYLDSLEILFGIDFGSIFPLPSLSLKSSYQKNQGLATSSVAGTTKSLVNPISSDRLNFYKKISSFDWAFYSGAAFIPILMIPKLLDQFERRFQYKM